MDSASKPRDFRAIGVILLLLLATRWFVAGDPRLLLTGDECVVGLMGSHLLEGRLNSGYFYGQHYGLAALEAAACAVGIHRGGIHTQPIKLSMLLLFVPAVLCFYRAASAWGGRLSGAAATAVWLTAPAWSIWSLQARGGYLTGLLGAMAILALASHSPKRRTVLHGAGLAACLTVVILAQPSWLAGVLPLLLGRAWLDRRWKPALIPLGMAGVLSGILHAGLIRLTPSTWPSPALHPGGAIRSLPELPGRIWRLLTTNTFSQFPDAAGYYLAGLCLLVLLGIAGVCTVRWARGRTLGRASTLLGLATVGQLAGCLLLPNQARYLLPVLPWGIAWAVITCLQADTGSKVRRTTLVMIGVAVVAGLGGFLQSHRTPASMEVSADAAFHTLIDTLEESDVLCAYSLDPLLQWQLMFYSEERITSRWTTRDERLPEKVRRVDEAYRAGEPTVIIGVTGWSVEVRPLLGRDTYGVPGLPYEFFPNPSPELLEELGFEL